MNEKDKTNNKLGLHNVDTGKMKRIQMLQLLRNVKGNAKYKNKQNWNYVQLKRLSIYRIKDFLTLKVPFPHVLIANITTFPGKSLIPEWKLG